MTNKQTKTRSVTTKEAADKLAAEDAKPWEVRLNEVILEIQKIIPEFKGRNMCTNCQRDIINHTANTVCTLAVWPKTEADLWQKDYHHQLVGTLAKINNEKMIEDMADMKEKRKSAQAACKSFESDLDNAVRKISLMEAYVEECKGDTRLAEEQEIKTRKKYDENMDELHTLREQMGSWRRGSEIEIRARRESSAESEIFKIKREKDNPTHKQDPQDVIGQVKTCRRPSTTGRPPNNFDLKGPSVKMHY
jgi:hypothetical protein